jgi:hypothetical protein
MIDIAAICKNIESKICEQHNRKPKAVAQKEAIKLSTCCENFQRSLEKIITEEIKIQAERIADRMVIKKGKDLLN